MWVEEEKQKPVISMHRTQTEADIETKTEEKRVGRGTGNCAGGGRRGETGPFNTPFTIKVIKSKNCFYFRSFL